MVLFVEKYITKDNKLVSPVFIKFWCNYTYIYIIQMHKVCC